MQHLLIVQISQKAHFDGYSFMHTLEYHKIWQTSTEWDHITQIQTSIDWVNKLNLESNDSKNYHSYIYG